MLIARNVNQNCPALRWACTLPDCPERFHVITTKFSSSNVGRHQTKYHNTVRGADAEALVARESQRMLQPRLVDLKVPVTKHVETRLDIKLSTVDMVLENNLPFDFLDSSSYIRHIHSFAPKAETYSSLVIKDFLQTNSNVLRQTFKNATSFC